MKTKLLTGLIVFFLLIGTMALTVQSQSTEDQEVNDETDETPQPTETPEPTKTTQPTETPEPTKTTQPTSRPTSTQGPTATRTRNPTITPKPTLLDNGSLVAIATGVTVLCIVALIGLILFKKRGPNEKKLHRMSNSEFNTWILKRIGGRPASSMETSFGIDGFTSLGYPLAIKQSDSVGTNTIDLFAAAMAKSKARNGVIIAFGFNDDAIRGKVRARRGGMDIQMVTIQELLDNKRINL
ncbi:MAG: hypothetical protein LBQ98_03695 [Nitrososphaerota archaeon]|nr:hypothetical protein [Nitrososphaerota archaeon]